MLLALQGSILGKKKMYVIDLSKERIPRTIILEVSDYIIYKIIFLSYEYFLVSSCVAVQNGLIVHQVLRIIYTPLFICLCK
jgi:hypothetical protein